MKKLFTLVAVASLSLVACGPSADEIAAKAKLVTDSIAAVEAEAAAALEAQRITDSTNAFTAAAEAEAKRIEDSIAAIPVKGKK